MVRPRGLAVPVLEVPWILHFEPSLEASSSRSDVITSRKILSPQGKAKTPAKLTAEKEKAAGKKGGGGVAGSKGGKGGAKGKGGGSGKKSAKQEKEEEEEEEEEEVDPMLEMVSPPPPLCLGLSCPARL